MIFQNFYLAYYLFLKVKVLVSGASGFIGYRLVTQLVENNHSVTAIINNKPIENSKLNIIQWDLSQKKDSFPDEKYDIVYHLAALTPLEKNKDKQKKVNYQGTVNFFNQIKDKTKFFVYVSGLGVFGDVKNKVDENTKLNPHTDYAKIRLEAQRFLEKNCKENNIGCTVVYLGEVYGNGGWFADQIIPRLKKGKLRIPHSGNYYRSFIHVDDVANALIVIGEKNIQNEAFIVTDSSPVLFSEFINYVADKLHVKHPGNVPNFLAKAVMGKDAVALLTVSLKTSNEKLKKIIELKYPSYEKGIDSFL